MTCITEGRERQKEGQTKRLANRQTPRYLSIRFVKQIMVSLYDWLQPGRCRRPPSDCITYRSRAKTFRVEIDQDTRAKTHACTKTRTHARAHKHTHKYTHRLILLEDIDIVIERNRERYR